jgi:hypothetical protein
MDCREHPDKKQLGASDRIFPPKLLYRNPACHIWGSHGRRLWSVDYDTDVKCVQRYNGDSDKVP